MSYAGKAGQTRRLRSVPQTGTSSISARNIAAPRPVDALATGLVAGLVLGIGVALLLAPQSGSETRRAMRRRLRRVRRRGRDAWDDLRYELHRARRELRRARGQRQERAQVDDGETARD